MGTRITILHKGRLTYKKRPADQRPKPEPRVAMFDAGDVVWQNEAPIEVRYIADAEGVHDVREHRHPQRTGMYSDHLTRLDDAEADALRQVVEADEELIHSEIDEHGVRNMTVRVRTATPGDGPRQMRQYYYVYVNGVPHGRQHNETNETDYANISHDTLRRLVEVKWMHADNPHPVHQENFAFELFDDNPMFTLEMAHRQAHGLPPPNPVAPNTATILDPGARPHDTPKRVHPWVRWLDAPPQRWLERWRHWQRWEKTGPGRHMERHTMNWISSPLFAFDIAIWVFVVAPRLGDLLQILKL